MTRHHFRARAVTWRGLAIVVGILLALIGSAVAVAWLWVKIA